MKAKYVALLCVCCLVVGFFVGRKTISYDTEIRYVQGEVVRDTIAFPVPVFETKFDTIRLIEYDTIKTLIDWNTERYYTERLFNDNRGLLDVSATVQFNTLRDFSYSFTPIYKQTTRYRYPVWQPYVGASYNTLNQISLVGGIFCKKWGIETQYIYDLNGMKRGYGFGVRYKF